MKLGWKRYIARLLVCLMILSGAVVPAAAADKTTGGNSSTSFRTSYSDTNYVSFTISGNTLIIEGQLILDQMSGYMVCVGSNQEVYSAASGKPFSARFSLPVIKEPTSINIYTKQAHKSSYWGFIWDTVYIVPMDGGYVFAPSLILDHTLDFCTQWLNPGDFLNADIPEAVREKSAEIVGDETDDYRKIFLLHQWVAKNIYYDYDAYRNGGTTFYRAEEILANGRSVCAGYAELLRQLILAQGIPCMEAQTYALGVSTSGGSFAMNEEGAAITTSNHAHVEAYVNGRWVIMDPTWDSQNKYEHGSYMEDDPNGYYYFDIAPEALAMDHKYITRGNGQVRLGADGTVTNRNTREKGTKPSSWAMEEVGHAVELGMIPYHLQSAYQQSITREEFCETIVGMLMVRYGVDTPETLMERFGLVMQDHLFLDTDNRSVYAANLLGIVNGTGQNSFSPDSSIARQEAATMLMRAAGVMGMEIENAPQTGFSDGEKIRSWARDGVNYVCAAGVMKGISGEAFDPEGTLTREQAYLTILRLYHAASGSESSASQP